MSRPMKAVVALATLALPVGSTPANDDAGISLRLELVGRLPHAYQAVRLRLVVANTGEKEAGPLPWADQILEYPRIQGPSGAKFRKTRSIVIHDLERASIESELEARNDSLLLYLPPGTQNSVSFAVAANWADPSGTPFLEYRGEALFPSVGVYTLLCRYQVDPPARRYLESSLTVPVEAAEGSDQTVLELINADPQLAAAMMSPVNVPSSNVVPRLLEIVQRYPDSSYADYAHFSLGRGHIRGIGFLIKNQQSEAKLTAKLAQLMGGSELRRDEESGDTKWVQRVAGLCFGSPLGERERSAVLRLRRARDGSPAEKDAAIKDVVSLVYVSEDDCAAAVEHFRQVKRRDFPYGPNVLVAMRAASRHNKAAVEKIMGQLVDKYGDAIETLNELAGEMGAEEWEEFRKPKTP